ncbi:MAG: type I-G CRISPR-associated helicase/endonuclease Cas3g [Gammaproteobacteria bacterium]
MEFDQFFVAATGFTPHSWQQKIAEEGLPALLSVPTGLGKTEGVVLAWAWRRLVLNDRDEPRHIVYCLPMRTLVTQTRERLARCFDNLAKKHGLEASVHILMGGDIDEEWARRPEQPWVLIGTQDMLLSRALNRGYSMSRYRWPMHFGLLNNDCRWVVDEVQLMGPGLWTTSQLDWMRRCRFGTLRTCPTTWMSATVGGSFLDTPDRRADGLDEVKPFVMEWTSPQITNENTRTLFGALCNAKRAIEFATPPSGKKTPPLPQWLAQEVESRHRSGTLSLVVCNTVALAQEIFTALSGTVPRILLTSRFRPCDRRGAERQLITFEARRKAAEGGALPDEPGLICVSTQVVEAGVDISAHQLWTELAPWPSMIQRLGRMNRYGRDNRARAFIFENSVKGQRGTEDARIGPYAASDIKTARQLVAAFVPLTQVQTFQEALETLSRGEHAQTLVDALEPALASMPRAVDVHGLFSTEPDVFGGFTDVSAFVRGSDPDADITVFWRVWQGMGAPREEQLSGPAFRPKEGCSVAAGTLKAYLKMIKAPAFLWNGEARRWDRIRLDAIRPGMRLMLHGVSGGYDSSRGWTGSNSDRLDNLEPPGSGRSLRDDQRSECGYWAALQDHLDDARREAEKLSASLELFDPLREAVVESAGFHDIGKAHPRWQQKLPGRRASETELLAKTPNVLAVDVRTDADIPIVSQAVAAINGHADPFQPDQARGDRIRLRWAVEKMPALEAVKQIKGVFWAGKVAFRPGLRHEAASALAMWRKYKVAETKPYPMLAVYLAAAHHGKVRTVLRATSKCGDDVFGISRESEDLQVLGHHWPLDFSVAADGAAGEWSDDGASFTVDGIGWSEIVATLLGPWERKDEDELADPSEPRDLGPFKLAYLEALVVVADWRASAAPSRCIKPGEERGA